MLPIVLIAFIVLNGSGQEPALVVHVALWTGLFTIDTSLWNRVVYSSFLTTILHLICFFFWRRSFCFVSLQYLVLKLFPVNQNMENKATDNRYHKTLGKMNTVHQTFKTRFCQAEGTSTFYLISFLLGVPLYLSDVNTTEWCQTATDISIYVFILCIYFLLLYPSGCKKFNCMFFLYIIEVKRKWTMDQPQGWRHLEQETIADTEFCSTDSFSFMLWVKFHVITI